jgi:hypothetical protein
MTLPYRIDLLVQLGKYMLGNDEAWLEAKEKASYQNAWFNKEFVDLSCSNIAKEFLQKEKLLAWAESYHIPAENSSPKNIGVVMAGNIPLVGFHDFLCVFITGHQITIKPSSKDDVLLKHLVQQLYQWEITVQNLVSFAENLKGCDAYIATGSNNSSRYFDYYFGKFPNIIRRNRTSIAILDGTETPEELDLLSDDIQFYFGLGCRNVTKLYVPEGYDFVPLLKALEKYDHFFEFHKYKHNYDYHLALQMMGNRKYMTNGSVIFSEEKAFYSPISQVNYEFYTDKRALLDSLEGNEEVQCLVGHSLIGFGNAQQPSLTDYADGVDTMDFLLELK